MPRRLGPTVMLGGLLAVAALAGCGKNGGSGPGAPAAAVDSSSVEDLVLARVGKRAIRVRDLDYKVQIQFAKMFEGVEGAAAIRQKSQILEQMVNQYAWVYAGEKNGFDKDEEFRRTLELSRMFILSNLTVQKLVYEKSEPTEEEIRQYYEENPDQFRLVARVQALHILVPTRAEAEAVRAAAMGGEDWGELVRRHSVDKTSSDVGGSIGTVTYRSDIRGFGPPTPGDENSLNSKIMALGVGEISQPIQSSRGWSLFKVTERNEEHLQPLEEASPVIRDRLMKKRANELFTSTLDGIRQEAKATVDSAAWMSYTFAVLDPDQLFQLAQGEKNVLKRIQLYRELAARHPESPRAPQALFMVGFTYADDLHKNDEARDWFNKMLEKYPEHELASSARWMLENMDKGLDNLPYADQIKRRATTG